MYYIIFQGIDMRMLILCNNYGKKYDGIGAYASKVYCNLTNIVISAETNPKDKISRVFGLGMSIAVFKAAYVLLKQDIKKVVIEYPFIEWNPLICFAFVFLKIVSILTRVELISTIHEYDRVNRLRKLVVIYLTLISSKIIVTEGNNFKKLKRYNNNIYKIEIPSNIEFKKSGVNKLRNSFVFFGMVNRAKAFNEMLDAWDEFNNEGLYSLVIVSASYLNDIQRHKNVTYAYNVEEEEVETIMLQSAFSILPIKPYIDEKNATFKTSCLAGCISIGVFCDEYKNLDFTVNMLNYDKLSFIKAFNKCTEFNSDALLDMQSKALHYGEDFKLDSVRSKILQIISQ